MNDSSTSAPGRTGYRLVLPPGWAKIALRDHPERAVDAILDPKFEGLPMDSYGPIKKNLRTRLMTQIEQARKNQGIDLYLPVEQVHGATLACSFVVAHMPFETMETPNPDDVLVAFAAHTEHAKFLEVDGASAVRTEQLIPGRPKGSDEQQYSSRRVDYLLAIPHAADDWLSISFSTIADGDPTSDIAHILIELFDAIMSTFTWVHQPTPNPNN